MHELFKVPGAAEHPFEALSRRAWEMHVNCLCYVGKIPVGWVYRISKLTPHKL